MGYSAISQENAISNNKKMRYLRKIERKNDRFVRKQEKETQRVLSKLSKQENTLYGDADSIKLDSTFVKTNFLALKQRFSQALDKDPEVLLTGLSKPVFKSKIISVSSISENLSGDIKDYLSEQLTVSSFFSDSACATCTELKAQSEKTKQNITKTSEKLERIKSIQAQIRKHQETLKNYGVKTSEWTSKIKGIEKTSYYYNQGINGFKDMYTNPTKGIESSLLKKLSFSKDFKLFQNQLNTLASNIPSLATGSMPNMSGYQTKVQVQAMLPQNASGITQDMKTQLLANMQNALTQFTELKEQKPDLSMLKDKPDFKVNPYKGLPLKKRLVPGFTFQPQIKKLNEPFITDLGATLGFKLTQRLTPMIGLSTKVGLGKDIYHIAFTYQGIVAKAGFDSKLVYGFSIQSWYEATWRPLPGQVTIDHIPNYPQPSLIIGICNTYRISKKVNGTFLIGYNFFYNKQIPYSSPWVLRMGWQ